MATENKGVMVYLPKEVEEYITEFCAEYSITRKDKEGNILPSLGTGIVTYLKSKMSGESPSDVLAKPKSQGTGLTRDEVLDLISEYFTSHSPSNGLSSGLSKDEVIDLVKSELLSASLIEELRAELSEVSEFARNLQGEIVKVKKALRDRSVTTESNATTETAPAKTTLLKEGEYISFTQLAKQLGYSIPDGVKASNPRTEGAEDLIAFAASLGQSYGWHGKKQKFYRTDGN